MWNWLAALLIAVPISYSLNPNYREDSPEVLNFCLMHPEDGYVMEEFRDRVYVEIPCTIWLSPPALRKYIDDCFNTGGPKTGNCLHVEI